MPKKKHEDEMVKNARERAEFEKNKMKIDEMESILGEYRVYVKESLDQDKKEYEAMKVATSCYLYSKYYSKGIWPDDNDGECKDVMNLIVKLKEELKEKKKEIKPDCMLSYNVNQQNVELPNVGPYLLFIQIVYSL